jgi:hypothetical protein
MTDDACTPLPSPQVQPDRRLVGPAPPHKHAHHHHHLLRHAKRHSRHHHHGVVATTAIKKVRKIRKHHALALASRLGRKKVLATACGAVAIGGTAAAIGVGRSLVNSGPTPLPEPSAIFLFIPALILLVLLNVFRRT